MTLHVGLAYSNIQNKYGAPSIVAGIVVNTKNLMEIQKRKLEIKEKIIRHENSLGELQETLDDIDTYLDNSVTIVKQNVRGQVGVISDAYVEAVRSLLADHYPLINEGIVISYRKIVGIPGFKSRDISAAVREKLQNLTQKIEAREDENDYPTQIARLLARLEYERIRQTKVQFLNRAFVKSPGKYIQFHKISYQRMSPEDYVDNFVSLPEFALRKFGKGVYRLPIHAENTFVDLQPTARFCLGTRENGWIKPCGSFSEEEPYGNIIYGSGVEKCNLCREKEIYAECLKRKPSCDGTEAVCGNKYFAGGICNGAFGLYITRFGDSLKVGQAFLPNLISRLLEQGSNSALLIYPIFNIARAYELEHSLKAFFESHIEEVRSGISRVTLRSPVTKKKVTGFLEHWERVDKDVFLHISEILENTNLKLQDSEVDFSLVEKKVSSFIANYKAPPELQDIKTAPPFERFRGKIVGYRGSVIFLEDKIAVDMKRLQGYVLRGRIKCRAP